MKTNRPLTNITVVELTVHRAGPFCGAFLADLGADVIKIERPDVGDPARTQGPGPSGKSGYFMANNRNKRSVELDLKTDAGTDAALELLADADVFIENFGYGVADRLGVGYEDVCSINNDIIYASIKGYGETGPAREKKGLDLILQAEAGVMSVTGPEDGPPVKVGQAIGDLTAGMQATIGILARLHDRNRIRDQDANEKATVSDDRSENKNVSEDTGAGGKLDVGLFDAIVSVMNEYLTFHSLDGHVPGPQGTSHQSMVPYQLFETADSYIVIGVPSDDRWDAFVDLVGREELREYGTNAERVEHERAVVSTIQEAFAEQSTDYWRKQLTAAGFPNGPLNDVGDVIAHEQAEARDLLPEIIDPDAGSVILPGHPINFPDYDTSISSPAPRLGEHTEAVFERVADDQTTLDQWREGGAFGG